MADEDLLDEDPVDILTIDPEASPMFVGVVGRKGSGKSEFSRSYVRSWPFDALVIDPTRDFDPDGDFTVPWPGGDSWPARGEDPNECRRFQVVPDRANDPKHREAIDRLVLLAHEHPEPVLVVCDEGRYLFASDEKILPGTDVVTNEGRHGPTWLWVNNPRAMGIRPILWHQCDWLVAFDLPNGDDVQRIAETGGIEPAELEGLVKSLQVEELPNGNRITGFVLIDKRRHEVFKFPILPL